MMPRSRMSPGQIRLLFAAAGLLLLLPFIGLAFCTVPSSDDFAYAGWQRAWGTINANLTCYFGWGGRYVSNLLLTTCNPLSYSRNPDFFLIPYQMHCLVLLALLLSGSGLLVRRIFGSLPLAAGAGSLSFAILLFFLANPTEFLFWMAGSYTYAYGLAFALLAVVYLHQPQGRGTALPRYLLPAILAFLVASGLAGWLFRKPLIAFLDPRPGLFLGAVLALSGFLALLPYYLRDKPLNPLARNLLTGFCLLLAIGSNEIFAFILVPWTGLCFLFRVLAEKKSFLSESWPPVVAMAAGLLNLLAPSTFARQNLQKTRLTSFDLFSAGDWWGVLDYAPGILPAGLFLLAVYLFLPVRPPARPEPVLPGYSLASRFVPLAGLVYLLLVLPVGLSALSGPLPDRAMNPLLVFALMLVALLIGSRQAAAEKLLPFRAGVLALAFLSSVAWVTTGTEAPYWWRAVRFLSSPDAVASLRLHRQRFHQLDSCRSEVCRIPVNPYHPTGLLAQDNAELAGDPPSWINYKRFTFAAYYKKKSIIAR